MKSLVIVSAKKVLKSISENMRSHAVEVHTCKLGRCGLERLQTHQYDLIVVSYQLDDMPGVECIRKIREMTKQPVPVVCLAKRLMPYVQKECYSAGATQVYSLAALDEFDLFVNEFSINSKNAHSSLHGKVLYIEDVMSIAMVTTARLEKMGLTVTHYTAAEPALEALEKERFDLVLTDIVLEGNIDGLRAVQIIRGMKNKNATIPILAMSAFDEQARKIELLRSGANDYVSKPVIPEELEARVHNLVTTKHLMDALESQQAYLEKLALTDQLTGLNNRYYLFETGSKKLKESARHGIDLSVLVFDIDHFKRINDENGHQFGDQVLSELGDLIKNSCRQEDLAARMGGEEFVIMLSHCNLENAEQKAQQIRMQVEAMKPSGVNVTVSIGVVQFESERHDTLERLISDGDEAAYRAKSSGRNRVVLYENPDNTKADNAA